MGGFFGGAAYEEGAQVGRVYYCCGTRWGGVHCLGGSYNV
jgi:hypothetical protein